mmetsp:Transcript_5165/g.12723  ORF Transcript_5165/g.12723 Transcript_5165/m.12723 type:complete len:221 (-) Transcript_5165:3247-3909(-)
MRQPLQHRARLARLQAVRGLVRLLTTRLVARPCSHRLAGPCLASPCSRLRLLQRPLASQQRPEEEGLGRLLARLRSRPRVLCLGSHWASHRPLVRPSRQQQAASLASQPTHSQQAARHPSAQVLGCLVVGQQHHRQGLVQAAPRSHLVRLQLRRQGSRRCLHPGHQAQLGVQGQEVVVTTQLPRLCAARSLTIHRHWRCACDPARLCVAWGGTVTLGAVQ